MTRPPLAKPFAALLILCALLAPAVQAAPPSVQNPAPNPAPSKAPPNIVILVADDWGYSDVGAYGSEIATPNIDALAQRGAKFANFHVAASCSPTRAMLMTGVDNHRNGLGNMPETMPDAHLGQPGYSGVLDDRAVTLASMLRDHGYRTYASGKWHLGKTPDTLPPQRGFDRSFIQADSGSDNWEERTYLPLYDKAAWFEDGKEARLPADYYSSKFIVDKALEYIGAPATTGNAAKPFFAYLAFQANHIPLQAPLETVAKYRGAYQQGWTALRQQRQARAIALGLIPEGAGMVSMASTADWNALSDADKQREQRHMEVYAAMAETMDQQIGRLIARLKETGQYENTIFVFLSDNGAEPSDPLAIQPFAAWIRHNYMTEGEGLGGKGSYAAIGPSWASAAAAPLAGYKFWAGEGGLRVPLIVAGLPGMKRGHTSSAFSHVTDLMPTLLEAAGIPAHDGHYQGKAVPTIDGRSLLPLLRGESTRVYAEDQPVGYELSGNAALFKGDYKLVKNRPPVGDGQWHLYNIASDPGEVKDLAVALPTLFKAMQDDYAAYAQAKGVLPMPPDYDHIAQGKRYALKHVLMPKLQAAAPWLLAALAVVIGGWAYWRRRARGRA